MSEEKIGVYRKKSTRFQPATESGAEKTGSEKRKRKLKEKVRGGAERIGPDIKAGRGNPEKSVRR